eukprot:12425852-Karenia_brevis.AAC.1
MVKAARLEEMRYFKKMGVYKKVPLSKCYELTGKGPIDVRWIDTNKQDSKNPLYRSRLVAKQFKTGNDPDLFAATPPLEAMKIIISTAATKGEGETRKIMVNDVSRAYFYARSESPTFVKICDEDWEDGDEHKCGELQVSMYGTRQAAQNWQNRVSEVLVGHGFQQAKSSPCVFYNPTRDILTMVHGDDFLSTAVESNLKWLESILRREFEIKTKIVGPEGKDEKQLKILNRIITYREHGIDYEPDPRHAEIIVEQLGLKNAKELSTPGVDQEPESANSDETLSPEQTTKYKSIVARANFLALDRPEIQFSVKECAKSMSKPTRHDWARLKRLGRFLKGHLRTTTKYNWQKTEDTVTIFTDANWAGDKSSRKSTSGGVIKIGQHLIKSWSKTQALIALSSAESELYGCIKATAEGLGVMSMLADAGRKMRGIVMADASAALGIISRKGLGKVRHLDTSYLWIQEVKAKREMQFGKVDGKSNPADLMTKYLAQADLYKHFQALNLSKENERPQAAAELSKIE